VTARRQRHGESTGGAEGETRDAGSTRTTDRAVTAGTAGGGSGGAWLRGAAGGMAAVAVLLGAAGCAKMDAALDKQWVVVDFNPGTSITTALHVREACGHIQNTPPMALPASHSVINIMYGIKFDTTNSSPAQLAELQTCLGKFKSVQTMDQEDAGDEGS
jgi:hypothetical protein